MSAMGGKRKFAGRPRRPIPSAIFARHVSISNLGDAGPIYTIQNILSGPLGQAGKSCRLGLSKTSPRGRLG